MHSNQSKQRQNIFFYLVLLTVFFVLLEISFFIQCNKAYLSDFTFVSNQIKIPAVVMPDILHFLLAQFAIHGLYCVAVWFAAAFSAYLFKLKNDSAFNLAIILWFTGIAAALSSNQYLFPNSKFTELSMIFLLNQSIAAIAAFIFSAVFIAFFISGVLGFLVWLTNKSFNYTLFLMLILAAGSWIALNQILPAPQPSVLTSKPNVIIIGIDSLRPDFVSYYGAEHTTPFIDSILQQSTVFTEAVTPLARTFPSWSGILLGKHPRESGIRFNLADTSKINLTETLPAIFKQHGYETIYATDETRFSNIDHSFGFNEIITPPIGLNDFLLGTFNDFPLSNLIINTAVGRWLFPYSYANRPAFATYDPDSFIQLLRPALLRTHQQPLFLAVHFCLPHYPYLWSSLNGMQFNPQERYRESIVRVDQQIKSFFDLLRTANLLEHTIVVLLSDHGEALELAGDRITQHENYLGKFNKAGKIPRFYPPSLDDEAVNQSAGHGTDVLGLPQYHTLLAFKLFGMKAQNVGDIKGVVSFTALKPALLELADIQKQSSPLAAVIRSKSKHIPAQHIFIESDYSPEAIRTVYPETRKVLLDGIQLFQINPINARLTVKSEMGKMIIHSKQFADIYDHWMLALYPQNNKIYTPILIDLNTGRWTNDLQSAFAQQSPAKIMMTNLKSYYQQDLA